MKPKTGFESGSSPTATARVAESGALLQTGRGLEEAKRRIMEAFEKIRQPAASQPMQAPTQVPNQAPVQAPVEYTEEHKTRFHERAKRLSLAALETPRIVAHDKSGIWNIEVPSKTAEELIAEALRRDE